MWFLPSIMWVQKLVTSTFTHCAILEAQKQDVLLNLEFTHCLHWLTNELQRSACLYPIQVLGLQTTTVPAPLAFTLVARDPHSGPHSTN